MNKKLLAAIPRPEVEDSFYDIAKDLAPMYIITAFKHDEETLVLNFFYCKNTDTVVKVESAFRVFCQKDGYITQDLNVDKVKWKTASALYLCDSGGYYSSHWWSNRGLVFANGEALARQMLTLFYEPNISSSDGVEALERYQKNLQEQRLALKHKKETDVIDTAMEKFGSIPDDYQEFAENVLFSKDNYIFYSNKKKKAHCTKCHWDFEINRDGYLTNKIGIYNYQDKPKHNHSIVCPYCNNYLEAKSENTGRKNLTAIRWSVLVQSHGEEVFVRYFRHIKEFKSDYRHPKYSTNEEFRTIHTKEKAVDYEWNKFKQTGIVRWIYQKESYSHYWAPSEYVLPSATTLYNTRLNEDLKGTCMQYSCAEEYMNWLAEKAIDPRFKVNAWAVDEFFNSYREYPWIEQLIKCGMSALTKEILCEYHIDKSLFKNGRTICETLGITKNMFNILRHQTPAKYRDIQIMKYYREVYNKDILERDFDILKYIQDAGYVDMYKHFIDFMKYSTLHKLNRYLREQNIFFSIDYFDYIRWLEEMGCNMKSEFNLYPKNFKKAHDERSKEYLKFQEKKHQLEVEQFNALLKKMKEEVTEDNPVNVKIQGLFIRLPNSLDELSIEGEALHHCVATYKDRVANGETLIYFIRQEKEPDKPFYTLEWKGKVVQCRGRNNCSMTPEVKAFVSLFEENMAKYITRKAG